MEILKDDRKYLNLFMQEIVINNFGISICLLYIEFYNLIEYI